MRQVTPRANLKPHRTRSKRGAIDREMVTYGTAQLLGSKTASEMLKLANETTLLQSCHEIAGKHYASYPATTQIYVWRRHYSNDYGSGYEFLQTLNPGISPDKNHDYGYEEGEDFEPLSFSYELSFEFDNVL